MDNESYDLAWKNIEYVLEPFAEYEQQLQQQSSSSIIGDSDCSSPESAGSMWRRTVRFAMDVEAIDCAVMDERTEEQARGSAPREGEESPPLNKHVEAPQPPGVLSTLLTASEFVSETKAMSAAPFSRSLIVV